MMEMDYHTVSTVPVVAGKFALRDSGVRMQLKVSQSCIELDLVYW
jgi:hypothetical protein